MSDRITTRPSVWDGMSTDGRTPVSRFVRAERCVHCPSELDFVVPPKYFPVDTIAITCYACGRVRRYVDNLLIMTAREAAIERQSHMFAVRGHIGIQPSTAEVARELILAGLEGGLTVAEVSASLNVQRGYVLNVAQAAGLEAA